MTEEARRDWARIDRLFEEALERPPEAREAFLQGACDGDEALLSRLRKLLAAEERVGAFLEESGPGLDPAVLQQISTAVSTETPLAEGEILGSYRIEGVLGQGGMSTVFRAERADGAYEQAVALKILRSDLAPEEMAHRMEAERQILASLSHPNIGRILDGGVTPEGRPYLVMDLVEGRTIHDYADVRGLSVEGRLRLFLQVARAVQHAHQNLVVHRDLKPSNILVDASGRAVLLDFGIAKLLSPSGESGPGTEALTRLMTPEYASPEQILGKPVTTATDVHALGVILHELLTGIRPFGDGTTSGYEVAKAICETEPKAPSSLVTEREGTPISLKGIDPGQLRGTLSGDLDAIILKALRKEPEARYVSVEAFVRDIEHFLQGRPVEARGGASLYRARKFVRRHRLSVATAISVAILTLVGGLALARAQALASRERDRARDQAERAQREADNARAAVSFLSDVFKGADPDQSPGDTITALELLEWGDRRVRAEFENNPGLKADLLGVLADAYGNLGYPERGQILLELSLEIQRAQGEGNGPEVAAALVRLGENLRIQRNFEEALPLYTEALATLRATGDTLSRTYSEALFGRGMAFRDYGNPDSAVALLQRVLDLQVATRGPEAEASIQTRLSLASALRSQGDFGSAESLYQEALPRFRRMVGPRDPTLPIHLNNYAFLLAQRGDHLEAARTYQESLTLLTATYGRGHPNALLVANNLAGMLERAGQLAASDSVLSENVQAARVQWPEGHWRLGQALKSLGVARLRVGDSTGASAALEEALTLYRDLLGPAHLWTVMVEANISALALAVSGSPQARERLDVLFERFRSAWEEGGGSLPSQGRGQLEPFVHTLEALGLEEEAHRFGGLLPEG